MIQHRQQLIFATATLSVAISLVMAIVAITAPKFPIWPIIFGNWIAFISVTWLVGHQVSLLQRDVRIGKLNHNIWRLVIVTFAVCGYFAVFQGATIV